MQDRGRAKIIVRHAVRYVYRGTVYRIVRILLSWRVSIEPGCSIAIRSPHRVLHGPCGPMFRAISAVVRTHAAYFLPLFLIPWEPAFMGPLPLAFAAISARALASVMASAPDVVFLRE